MTSPAENRPADAVAPPPPPAPLPYNPAPPTSTDPSPAGTDSEPVKITPTRTSMIWTGIWAGVVVLILLIVFIAQNTASVEIAFFALEGRIPLALALLIAGVAGAIIAMAVAALRIIQLRRLVRRR